MNNVISHLGYYNISWKPEEDSYFIEVRSTSKKPKEWTNVKISVFDSWCDDLKYYVVSKSDYIWIRVNKKFGIGSLTFCDENDNKRNKDFVVIHEYTLKKKFNPVTAIFCYPQTREKIDLVKEHILSLSGSGIPIYLCSDLECPEELIELCDGYIYTGPGNLCTVPDQIGDKIKYLENSNKYPVHIFPQEIKFYDFHGFINGKGSYLWPAANSFFESVKKLHQMGFSHIMLSEGEFLLDELDYDKPEEILKDMWSNNISLDFFYTSGSHYLQCYLWFAELEYLVDSLRDVSPEDKNLPRGLEDSGTTAFLHYERYYLEKLLSNSPEKKIRVRTPRENQKLIDDKYWYTNRAEILFYEEEDFKLADLNTWEKLSFPLYFPNIKRIFPSISSSNSRSDILDSGSFKLDIRREEENRWIILVNNISLSRVIDLGVKLFNLKGEIVHEFFIDLCYPDDNRYFFIDTGNEEIKKSEYFVYLNGSKDYFYNGEFIYFPEIS